MLILIMLIVTGVFVALQPRTSYLIYVKTVDRLLYHAVSPGSMHLYTARALSIVSGFFFDRHINAILPGWDEYPYEWESDYDDPDWNLEEYMDWLSGFYE